MVRESEPFGAGGNIPHFYAVPCCCGEKLAVWAKGNPIDLGRLTPTNNQFFVCLGVPNNRPSLVGSSQVAIEGSSKPATVSTERRRVGTPAGKAPAEKGNECCHLLVPYVERSPDPDDETFAV